MTTLHWPEAQRWNADPLEIQAQSPSLVQFEPGRFDLVDGAPLPEPVTEILPVLEDAVAAGDGDGEGVGAGLTDVTRVVTGFAAGVGEAEALFEKSASSSPEHYTTLEVTVTHLAETLLAVLAPDSEPELNMPPSPTPVATFCVTPQVGALGFELSFTTSGPGCG